MLLLRPPRYFSNLFCALGRLLVIPLLCPPIANAQPEDLKGTIVASLPPNFSAQEIILLNAPYLSQKEEDQLLAPYRGRKVSTEELQALVEKIKGYYLIKGYPTFNVQVVLEDASEHGLVKLKVVEGIVARIRMGKDDWRARAQMRSAFLWMEGGPLYLPYLEQGLDQMNTVPSTNASMTILPGRRLGDSIIQINNVVTHPWRLALGINNQAEEQPGQLQGQSNFGLDNLLSVNDSLLMHYSRSIKERPSPEASPAESESHKFSEHKSAQYSLILGNTQLTGKYGTIKTGLLPSSSNSSADPLFAAHLTAGSVAGRRLMLTRNNHKAYLSLGAIYKDKKGDTAGIRTDVSAQKLNIYEGILSYGGPVRSGKMSCSVATSYGWVQLGNPQSPQGKESSQEIKYSPAYPFRKFNSQFLWTRLWQPYGQKVSYQLKASSQHSWGLGATKEHPSIRREYTALSGPKAVRGVQQGIMAANGLTMANEISLPSLFSFSRLTLPLSPFMGLDWSHNFSPLDPADRKHWLGGAAGFQYHGYGIHIEVTYAWPLLDADRYHKTKSTTRNLFSYSARFNLYEILGKKSKAAMEH